LGGTICDLRQILLSPGGGFSLDGTVGQVTDNQPMTGGAFTLKSSFWVGTYPYQVFLPRLSR